MLFCKHNSALVQAAATGEESHYRTPLSYPELADVMVVLFERNDCGTGCRGRFSVGRAALLVVSEDYAAASQVRFCSSVSPFGCLRRTEMLNRRIFLRFVWCFLPFDISLHSQLKTLLFFIQVNKMFRNQLFFPRV